MGGIDGLGPFYKKVGDFVEGKTALTGNHFLRYLMIENQITTSQLAEKMGYVRGTVHFHLSVPRLNQNFVQKLAHLTNKGAAFWLKKSFKIEDAEGVAFDMTKDASEIAKTTGSHTARLERERLRGGGGIEGPG